MLELSAAEYDRLLSSPDTDECFAAEDAAALLIVTDGGEPRRSPGALPVVVAWVGTVLGAPGPATADVVVGPGDVATLAANVRSRPLASTTLAVLLRSIERLDVEHGLAAESSTYSLLQGGPEFAAWRAAHPVSPVVEDEPVVGVDRVDDVLTITLDRPHRHNAVTTRLRDELHAALQLAVVDDSIESVMLRGNGPSFCSGGDLDEFGSRPDPVTAHRTRLARSPARLIHLCRDRVTVEIHGATLGGGIEMAAFAGRVVARPGTRIGLPEIELGLIPGAGGTVSITRRCGRQRTAALALATSTIDAATAMTWGLVDEIEPLGSSDEDDQEVR